MQALLHLLLLITAAGPTQQSPADEPTAAGPDGYVERFERAMAAFDRGEFEAAAAGFELAGEKAPGAPVWRASAGVALAHAGDREAAREMFEGALSRGYASSDLAALHPLGKEVAGDEEEAWPDGWVTTAARGMLDVHGDHRTARLRPRDEGTDERPMHRVGLFDLSSRNDRGFSTQWRVEHFRIAHATGSVERVEVVRNGWIAGGDDLCMPDRVDPWPRAIPFVRALRTGLLVDQPTDPISAKRQWRLSEAWARPFDPDRLQWSSDRGNPGRRVPAGLQLVDDAHVRERASQFLRASNKYEQVVVARIMARGDEREERLFVARCASYGSSMFFRAQMPLVFLDPETLEPVARLGRPGADLEAGHDTARFLGVDTAKDRLVLGFDYSGTTLYAYDLSSLELAWSRVVQNGALLALDGRLLSVGVDRQTATRLRDAETGALVFDCERYGFHSLGASSDGRWIWGEGRDSLALFSAREIDERPVDVARSEPLVHLWDVSGHAVAVACDGAWSVPAALLAGDGRVLVGDRLERAPRYAPWLLDPLHVRTIDQDRDRRARRFPRAE